MRGEPRSQAWTVLAEPIVTTKLYALSSTNTVHCTYKLLCECAHMHLDGHIFTAPGYTSPITLRKRMLAQANVSVRLAFAYAAFIRVNDKMRIRRFRSSALGVYHLKMLPVLASLSLVSPPMHFYVCDAPFLSALLKYWTQKNAYPRPFSLRTQYFIAD